MPNMQSGMECRVGPHRRKQSQRLHHKLSSPLQTVSPQKDVIAAAQIKDKSDEEAVRLGYYYSPEKANHAVKFIERFVKPQSGRLAGEQFHLFPWQQTIIERLMGWTRLDGTRRYRVGYCTCGRQNGKSFLSSSICLFMLLADGEISPCVASAANSRGQASIIFKNLMYSIQHDEELYKTCKARETYKTVRTPNNGIYASLSIDAKSALGYSFSALIFDEISSYPKDDLIANLIPTQAARRQPLRLAITTAGCLFDGPGYREYKYACNVRDSVIVDPHYFHAIFEADENAEIDDPKQWHKANPSLIHGTLIEEELADAAKAAKHSIAAEIQFKYFRLNRWQKNLNAYLDVSKWDACKGDFPNLAGKKIYLALDASSSRDLTAVVGLIPHDGKYYMIHQAFSPEAAGLRHERENLLRYQQYEAEGSLKITPGNGTDYSLIKAYIHNLSKIYKIEEIISDPKYCAETLMELSRDYTVYQFVPTMRNYSDPTKRLASLVNDRKIVHDGNQCLRWQCGNLQVAVGTRDDSITPIKGSHAAKIDSMVATIMCISRAVGVDSWQEPSVYESSGIFFV